MNTSRCIEDYSDSALPLEFDTGWRLHSCTASVALWLRRQASRAVQEWVETPAKRPSNIHMSSIQHQWQYGHLHLFSDSKLFFFFLSLQNQAWKRLRTQKESSWGGSREFVISSRGKCVTREANGGGSAQVVQSSWPCRAPSSSRSKQASYVPICVTHARTRQIPPGGFWKTICEWSCGACL